MPFTNGVAVFDGLSLSTLSNGTPYTFTITVTSGSLTFRTLTPDSVDVATAATPDVGVYYPLPLDSSLRGDAAAANADPTNATDDLYLVITYPRLDRRTTRSPQHIESAEQDTSVLG